MAQPLLDRIPTDIAAFLETLERNLQVGYLQIPAHAIENAPGFYPMGELAGLLPKNKSPLENLHIQSTSGFFPERIGMIPGAGYVYRFGKREDTFYCVVPEEDLVPFKPSMLRNLRR